MRRLLTSWSVSPANKPCRPDSRRETSLLLQQAMDSPEYEPPPPLSLDRCTNPWDTKNGHDDSPDFKNTHELRVVFDGHEAPRDVSSTIVTKTYCSQFAVALPSIEEQDREKGATVRINRPSGDLLLTQSLSESEMPDVDDLSHTTATKEISPFIATATPVPQHQATSSSKMTVISATISDVTEIDMSHMPGEYGPGPDPDSVEAKRKRKAAAYDGSILDVFLAKQRDAGPDVQPTAQELFKTQIWGHIDPRIAWPKELPPGWIEEKRREIDARGGRKANFGKLLTARVKKERQDKGWGMHQKKDVVHTERTNEHKKHLEELLGIKDLDEYDPGVRDGHLVMIERMVDQNGRRKRKGAPRVHPV